MGCAPGTLIIDSMRVAEICQEAGVDWTRNGNAWAHETHAYRILLVARYGRDGLTREEYVVRIGNEYFVGSTLEQAQQYVEQHWGQGNARG